MRSTLVLFVALFFCATGLLDAKTIKVPQDYAKIQLAINAAVNGDTVLVAEGTYFENIRITKKIVVGSLFLTDGNTSHASKTIINGSTPSHPDSGSVVTFEGAVDTTAIIIGFTITGGKGNKLYFSLENIFDWVGGGVCVNTDGGARISNSIIRDNILSNAGGVIYAWGGAITAEAATPGAVGAMVIIENNLILNNSCTATYGEGGGLAIMSNCRVVGNTIVRNTAVTDGGGFSIYGGCTVTLERNYISENTSTLGGGVALVYYNMTAQQPTVTMINNIFSANVAATSGHALLLWGCDLRLINNTLVQHTGGTRTIGVLTIAGGVTKVRMLNNILWNPLTFEEVGLSGATYYASNNCIRGGFAGSNNISSEPLFAANDSLYRHTPGSPCISAGVASASVGSVILTAPAFDYLGKVRPRPVSTRPDLGAIEHDSGKVGTGVKELKEQIPIMFSLSQNYPNPFNPTTTIRYALPSFAHVRLTVYTMLGQVVSELVNEQQSAGWKEVEWNASGISSGIYFYKLAAGNFVEVKKMMAIK